MLIKKRNKRSLSSLNTRFVDFSKNSPEFFSISFMPEQFTSGKNIFKFRPNSTNLDTLKKIDIEITDSNGDPIYHNILPYKESDGSLVVVVYVYESTPPGNCIITFIGTAKRDEELKPLPTSLIKDNNFKYQHKIYIDPEKKNDSEIIYIEPPAISIQERKFSVVEEKFLPGSGKIFSYGATGSYYLRDGVPTLNSRVSPFLEPLVDGILKFPTLGNDYYPNASFTPTNFSYETSIVNVLTPFEIELEDKLYVYGEPDKSQLITSVLTQPYEVTFSYAPVRRAITQNVKSYAQLDITGLQPDSGEVNRVKVFSKSTFKPKSDYELIYDFEILPNNILTDTGSILIEYPIGVFGNNEPYYYISPSGSSLNFSGLNYWNVERLTDTGPSGSLLGDSLYIFSGLEIIPDVPMSQSSELILVQTSSVQIPFYTDTDYRLKFDYILYDRDADSRGPGITAYVSGSSFVNTNSIGKLIGSIPTSSKDETIRLDYEMKIPIDLDGSGILKFVLRPGCKISNIRIVEDLDKGFSPERTRLYVPLKTDHRNEYLDFKLQFFNYSMKEANTSVKKRDIFFNGGNQYIYGDDNLITGSAYLSPYTSSQIHLYANVVSGTSGATSGSAIQSYGYSGTQNAISNPGTSSNYGFGITYGDPYNAGNYPRTSVQMINECGSIFDFRTTPPSFDLKLVGSNSSMTLGCSGSAGGDAGGDIGGGGGCGCDFETCGESYIKWDGCKIIISGAVDENGNPIGGTAGTGAPGANGTSGTSGTNGTSGTSGTNGTSGTSGTNGTSGTSGTGFNTINSPSLGEVLLSDGTTNAATASSNLIYLSNVFQVTGSLTITGSQFTSGSLTLTRPPLLNSVGLDLYGNGTRGGNQYFDFLRVTNTTGSAITPSKTLRLNSSGSIQVVNDVYNTPILTLNDSGSLSLPGTTGGSLSGLKNTGGGLSIANGNIVIFDDGNAHIHSTNPDANMWVNVSGSGNLIINGQTGAAGGVLIGTSAKTGFVTINGSAAYNLGSYGYLTSAGATGTASGTANYSLVADNRIAASEFNAYSDERLKDIIDNVSVNEATKFILNTHPIKFTWKNSGDGGIKVGYSAQEVIKAGFDNLVGVIPNESLEEYIDDDGFISPSGSQLTVNYEQIIPYHSVVIKHLLEKIEELQKEIQELKQK